MCNERVREPSFHMRLKTPVSTLISVATVHDASTDESLAFTLRTFALPWPQGGFPGTIRRVTPASHPAVTSNACGAGDGLAHEPGIQSTSLNSLLPCDFQVAPLSTVHATFIAHGSSRSNPWTRRLR